MTQQPPVPDDAVDALFSEGHRALRQWRAAHPRAPFDEIETAVDGEMQRVRARLVAEAARGAAEPTRAPARCPTCGERMQARGTRARTLTVAGDQPVTLHRSYRVCPVCGTGLFPP
jgi:YgiT-type zinc finger domain-containing protein